MNEDLAKLLKAVEPFIDALHKNDTDTLGRLSKDSEVLFVGSGSWTGSRTVTVGDLRELNRVVAEICKWRALYCRVIDPDIASADEAETK
jgi:hypothetical protein